MGLKPCLVFFFSITIGEVSGKYCWYSSQGYTKYFYCNSYEYCCGNSCCENFTQFYKLWYFWFCVVLSLLICSGGGYWYRKRYLQRRFMIGQPQTSAVVTMTQSSTASADGTCTRIPTGTLHQPPVEEGIQPHNVPEYANTSQGMTYQAACGCPPPPENQVIYSPPPSYPPPAPASTPATHPRGTLLLSGVVRITQKGSVIYQTVPCGPPPSYDSILQLAEACNCCQPNNERVTGSDGDLPGEGVGAAGPAGAEGGIGGHNLRRCVSNEYVQFCHVDGRQVVVGPHANQCPVCEINRRRAQQQDDDTYVYSPVTPPPPAGVDGVEDEYSFRERPQIPSYDDGPSGMDLIYNLPVDQAKVAIPGAVVENDKAPTESCVEGNCTCECVQCQADCHGNCIYGTIDLKGCRSQTTAQGKPGRAGPEGEGTEGIAAVVGGGGDEDQRNKQILQLHQQLRKRHEKHVMEHQKLLQDQHRAFQQQLAKASGHKYPRSRGESEDLDASEIPEEQEEEPLLPEPLKPTEYKRDAQWSHPLQELPEGVDKEEWPATKVETEKTERTPLLQPVTEVTDPEIRQQLLQRQLLEHQWRLHQQQQLEQGSGKDANGNAEEGLTLRREDGTNQLFTLQPLQPQQAKEPIYSLSTKQQLALEQKRLEEAKNEAAAWRIHNEQLQVSLPPVEAQIQQKQDPPPKKKRSFWPFSRDKSSTPEEKIMMEERQKRHPKQQEMHEELLQHRLIFREHPLMRQTSNQQLVQPKLSGQLPPQKVMAQNLQQLQQHYLLQQCNQQKQQKEQQQQQQQQQLQQQQQQLQQQHQQQQQLQQQQQQQQQLQQQLQQQQIQQQQLQQQQQQIMSQSLQEQELQSILVQHETQQEQQPQLDNAASFEQLAQQQQKTNAAGKTAQRVRFSFSDETEDKKDPSTEQTLLAQHAQLQDSAPKNETPPEKVERQRNHHQKILQKQAELLEKYKREWFSRKKKEGK